MADFKNCWPAVVPNLVMYVTYPTSRLMSQATHRVVTGYKELRALCLLFRLLPNFLPSSGFKKCTYQMSLSENKIT